MHVKLLIQILHNIETGAFIPTSVQFFHKPNGTSAWYYGLTRFAQAAERRSLAGL